MADILKRLNVTVEEPVVFGDSKAVKLLKVIGFHFSPSSVLGSERFSFIRSANLVVSKGQETLTGSYGIVHFVDSILEPYLVSRINPNTILYGHSIGPINNQKQKFLAKYFLKKISKIYTRDEQSRKLCVELYPANKIEVIQDLAYACIKSFLDEQEHSRVSEDQVVIIPNMAIILDQEKKDVYIQNIRKIIAICKQKRLKIILTSSVLANDWNNDFALCEEIKGKDPQIEIKRFEGLKEFLQMMLESKTIISSRLHPIIFATGMKKPVIAVSSATKVIGLLADRQDDSLVIAPFEVVQDGKVENYV